jgi:hypothetical protein
MKPECSLNSHQVCLALGVHFSDVSFLDNLPLEAGSFYVMDRGYVHFERLLRFTHASAYFVTRAKNKMNYNPSRRNPHKHWV